MAEELTGKGAGVGDATGTAGGAGVSEQPTAGQPEPAIAEGQAETPVPERVDLTQLADFRRWQAESDRREAQLRQQLQEREARLAEVQRQADEARLRDADPEEVAAYYQQRMAQLEAEQQQAAARQREQAEIVRQGTELLGELGLSPDTPGLEWSEEPTWDGLARLARSAAKVVALQGQAVTRETKTVAQEAAQQAKVEALQQAGVTKTTTAVGPAPARDLRAEYEQRREALKGTGDVGAAVRLRHEYIKKGLTDI